MPQVLIRNIDTEVLQKLKLRAQKNRRSLEAELRCLLVDAVAESEQAAFAEVLKVRSMFAGRSFSDSTDSISEDRER